MHHINIPEYRNISSCSVPNTKPVSEALMNKMHLPRVGGYCILEHEFTPECGVVLSVQEDYSLWCSTQYRLIPVKDGFPWMNSSALFEGLNEELGKSSNTGIHIDSNGTISVDDGMSPYPSNIYTCLLCATHLFYRIVDFPTQSWSTIKKIEESMDKCLEYEDRFRAHETNLLELREKVKLYQTMIQQSEDEFTKMCEGVADAKNYLEEMKVDANEVDRNRKLRCGKYHSTNVEFNILYPFDKYTTIASGNPDWVDGVSTAELISPADGSGIRIDRRTGDLYYSNSGSI